MIHETFRGLFTKPKPIIGMVHLRPLPGSPLYRGDSMREICSAAVEDALRLQDGGVDGVQIENTWDFPYLKGPDIGPETVAAMTAACMTVREKITIPFGVCCHLNGAEQAIAVAAAAGGKWVRVFEWSNAYISRSGYVEAVGGRAARFRSFVGATSVMLFCDVNVKHGSHFIISDRSVIQQARDVESDGADAVVVTGEETGRPPERELVAAIRDVLSIPVVLGSGVTAENIQTLLPLADAAIIGSYFKEDGNWKNPVDGRRVKRLMAQVERVRAEHNEA